MMIGMATSVMRLTDVISGGTVLPSAWNMLEDTNTTPEVDEAPRRDVQVLHADADDVGIAA